MSVAGLPAPPDHRADLGGRHTVTGHSGVSGGGSVHTRGLGGVPRRGGQNPTIRDEPSRARAEAGGPDLGLDPELPGPQLLHPLNGVMVFFFSTALRSYYKNDVKER